MNMPKWPLSAKGPKSTADKLAELREQAKKHNIFIEEDFNDKNEVVAYRIKRGSTFLARREEIKGLQAYVRRLMRTA